MLLKDILERRTTVETEMRSLYDAAEKAGEDLSGEKLEKWTGLKTELDDLAAKEDRARTRDDLDRRGDAKPIEPRGEGSAWALTREQRMADYVKATTGQDADGLSVGRVVRGVLTNDWKGAEAEKRAMGSGIATAGGVFIPDPVSATVIDKARNASVIVRAGALTIPMTTANMTMVSVATDPTAAWRAENASITESDGVFGAILVTPYSVAALVRVAAELMDDAPNFAATLDNMLAAALALKLDYAGLYGSGVGSEPLGLRNIDTAAGINETSMGANGAAQTTYDEVLDVLQAVMEDNGAPDTLIQSPRTQIKLAKLVTGISSDKTKLQPPAEYVALKKFTSNQVSITETQGSSGVASTTFIGGFENMALAVRQNITIEASKVASTAFEKNQIMVRAIMRATVAVLRPSQFGRLVGIL
jgi:HK97 family phage major capsid protein